MNRRFKKFVALSDLPRTIDQKECTNTTCNGVMFHEIALTNRCVTCIIVRGESYRRLTDIGWPMPDNRQDYSEISG